MIICDEVNGIYLPKIAIFSAALSPVLLPVINWLKMAGDGTLHQCKIVCISFKLNLSLEIMILMITNKALHSQTLSKVEKPFVLTMQDF